MALVQFSADAEFERQVETLKRPLDEVRSDAPLVVMIHGYRFRTGDPWHDPHAKLYGGPLSGSSQRCANWPEGLGFSEDDPQDGLCIGFGWNARAAHLANLARHGRNGFSVAYDRAAEAGRRLGDLIAVIERMRPDLAVDLFAHSLGARVALAALGAPGVERAILLGAAEDVGQATSIFARSSGASVYNIAARCNDAFDGLFEAAAPRPRDRRPRALGRAGLSGRRPGWIDLDLDDPELGAWLSDRGHELAPPRRVCHWSFYARPGVMALWRAVLRERAIWSIPSLRAAGVPEGIGRRRRRNWAPSRWRLGGTAVEAA